MKKALAMLVVVGLMAGTANAATLWMQFEGGANEITLNPSDMVNVEVWLDIIAGDNVSGLGQPFWPGDGVGVNGLVQESVTPIAGWDENSLDGMLGLSGQQDINVFAPTLGDVIDGPGSFLLAVMTLHQNDLQNLDNPLFPDYYPIMFGGDPTVTSALLNSVGSEIGFTPVYASYSGYYTWGQGASAISGKTGTTAWALEDNPLKVYCIPEPASLALLALGGLAIIRRR